MAAPVSLMYVSFPPDNMYTATTDCSTSQRNFASAAARMLSASRIGVTSRIEPIIRRSPSDDFTLCPRSRT
jgi:hypothetical protein